MNLVLLFLYLSLLCHDGLDDVLTDLVFGAVRHRCLKPRVVVVV